MTVGEVVAALEGWFPPAIAEAWDNVGLLLGDQSARVERVMTCLTVTGESAREAIREAAELVVSHHPIFFRPVQRLTAAGPEGAAFALARAGVSVYSPHTAFDGADEGINAQIAVRLGLAAVEPLRTLPDPAGADLGAGRMGILEPPLELSELARKAKDAVRATAVDVAGDPARPCRRIAVGCGAGGEFLPDAAARGCDALVTGEARFHDLLAAQRLGVGLILAGHYATERFAVETLAERIGRQWPRLAVWASRDERDPLLRLC